jgi:hypothetical protein
MAVLLMLAACEHKIAFQHPNECLEERDLARHEHLTVLNNQKWCSFIWASAYGGGDIPIQTGKAVAQPAHGTLRVTERPKAAYYDYKPALGYSGPDSFTIAPGGAAGGMPIVIEVEVRAPSGT